MEKLAALEASLTAREPDGTYIAQAKSASLGIFRLIVMGEIKKGKSSFINALTGIRDLVPVHSDVATSTIYKIHYGREISYTVYFESNAKREPLRMNKDEIRAYGTEDGNPDNIQRVDFIRVEAPAAILQNGLVIVDTPGVGGLFKHHRDITYKHAPNADAVFYVTDSIESPLGADDVSFLKELRSVTPLVYFVQTKAFSVDSNARIARMNNNLEILQREAEIPKQSINYFIVDSKMKLEADETRSTEDLSDSGFLPLMLFVNNTLRSNHEQKLARLAIERSTAKLASCDSELSARRAIFEAGTKAEMDKLEDSLKQQQGDLKRWDTETKPQLIADFQRGLTALRRRTSEKLSAFRPGGTFSQQTEAAIFRAPDVSTVLNLVGEASSNLPAVVSKICISLGDEISIQVKELLGKLATDAGTHQGEAFNSRISDVTAGSIDINTEALKRLTNRDRSGQTFDNVKTVVFSGLAGKTIGGVVGGIVGSVIPVVGTLIGSSIGVMIAGVFAAKIGFEMKQEHDLEHVQREALAALSQTLSSTHNEVQKSVNQIFEDIQLSAAECIQRIVRDATGRLALQNEELQRRRQSSQADVIRKRQELLIFTKELESLRAAFASARAAI